MRRVLTAFLLILLFSTAHLVAQTLPTTTLSIVGVGRPAPNQLTFSVFLRNTSQDTIELSGGAYNFDYTTTIINGGTATLAIVGSALPTALQPRNPVANAYLRFGGNVPPGAGNGLKIFPGDSLLVFKALLTTSAASLSADSSNIRWRTPSMASPNTTLGIYIGSVNTTIISKTTFYNPAPAALPVVPTWLSQVVVKDNGAGTGTITLGQGPTATNGLDTAYGEAALSAPTAGSFDARFVLPVTPAVASLKDFRNDTLKNITWVMNVQPGAGGYPLTVKWNKATLPQGVFFLKDMNGGLNINMKVDSQYVVTSSAITALKIEMMRDYCKPVAVDKGWNLLSVPLAATNMSTSALFPMASSSVFAYANGYNVVTTLENGKGYWARFDTSISVQVCGNPIVGNTIAVQAGWNLIASLGTSVPVASITTNPAGIINSNIFDFAFATGYNHAVSLEPGKGYWVRTSQAGTVVLSTAPAKSVIATPEIKKEWLTVTIRDNSGYSKVVYLAKDKISAAMYELPPVPPAGCSDVRFGNNANVANLNAVNSLSLQSLNYPVTIQVNGGDILVQDKINGKIVNQTLRNGQAFVLVSKEINQLTVKNAQLPTAFGLEQNYPNPFNPSTVITYQLPKNCTVHLAVYDVLGRKVADLVNLEQEAGNYSVTFATDQYHLASGMYIYRLEAGNFTSVKKMMLIR
ncbi:MAG: T9SS type A sorting domain-containing protein [Ignavibacteria bacterium]|nr:T9SS type A sorting domain-containing protein [Ignavibacteria bacterium]